jgi:hypothetical protein
VHLLTWRIPLYSTLTAIGGACSRTSCAIASTRMPSWSFACGAAGRNGEADAFIPVGAGWRHPSPNGFFTCRTRFGTLPNQGTRTALPGGGDSNEADARGLQDASLPEVPAPPGLDGGSSCADPGRLRQRDAHTGAGDRLVHGDALDHRQGSLVHAGVGRDGRDHALDRPGNRDRYRDEHRRHARGDDDLHDDRDQRGRLRDALGRGHHPRGLHAARRRLDGYGDARAAHRPAAHPRRRRVDLPRLRGQALDRRQGSNGRPGPRLERRRQQVLRGAERGRGLEDWSARQLRPGHRRRRPPEDALRPDLSGQARPGERHAAVQQGRRLLSQSARHPRRQGTAPPVDLGWRGHRRVTRPREHRPHERDLSR